MLSPSLGLTSMAVIRTARNSSTEKLPPPEAPAKYYVRFIKGIGRFIFIIPTGSRSTASGKAKQTGSMIIGIFFFVIREVYL